MYGKKFDVLTSDFFANERVSVSPNCYGFAYINLGDTAVRVNDVLLKPYPPGFPFLNGGTFAYVDEQGRLLNIATFTVNFLVPLGTDLHLQIAQAILIC